MQFVHAVTLGAIQGLTEFLPVSSSGHLVILQHLFGMRSPELLFDVAVHLGTLMAVLVFFRADIAAIAGALSRSVRTGRKIMDPAKNETDRDHLRLFWLIVAGSVPTGIIGLTILFLAGDVFASPLVAGLMLLVTGGLLVATRKRAVERKDLSDISMADALSIGVVQGLAVFPGISRSGATIAVALFLGLRRDAAARFSFLLSIPSVLGAGLLVLKDVSEASEAAALAALIGAGISLVVGYAALRLLVYIINQGRLYLFAPYCWAVGVLGISVALIAG